MRSVEESEHLELRTDLVTHRSRNERGKRLATPSSATAERGAVAAWWSEVGAYELRKKVARTRRARTRNSSYRDARSSSLQRMVRRLHWVRTDARKEFREQRPDSRWMPERECLESWDSVKRTRWRKAKNRRAVETLGVTARGASGRDRLAIEAEQECRRTRWRLTLG